VIDISISNGSEHRFRSYAMLCAAFATSRIAYFVAGVRFTTGSLQSAIQLLPERLLQHDLVRSLWYLHSQPPGFNAFVGILLHVPGDHTWVFGATYLLMGLALACTMYALMLELGTPYRVALLGTAVFVVSPITVLYENWLFYGYPVALMLCGAVLCFARFARTQRLGYAAGFGSLLSLLALTRASYHLLAVLAAAALVLLVCRREGRRRALVAVLLPLALVVGLYAKNTVQFGEPASSTWFGMNLAHMIFRDTSPELQADVAAHRVSHQALVASFAPLSRYPNVALPHTGVPALDIVIENGHTNYNNRAYIAISNRYLKDVLHFVARHPDVYVRRVADGYRVASTSAADYIAFRANRAHIGAFVGLENRLLGQVHDLVPPAPTSAVPGWGEVAWLVVLQYGAVVLAGAVVALRALRRRGRPHPVAQVTFLLIACTVGYATIVDNVLEFGDNNRFRFETDPLVWVAAVALFSIALTRLGRQRVGTTPADMDLARTEAAGGIDTDLTPTGAGA
jgi:hypothetical protein